MVIRFEAFYSLITCGSEITSDVIDGDEVVRLTTTIRSDPQEKS